MRDFPHDAAQDEQSRAVLSERIGKKIADYERYKFTAQQSCALNIFFDLAQEYVDLRYLYHLPVEVLRLFFSVEAQLYVRGDDDTFVLRTAKEAQSQSLPPLEAFGDGPVHSGPWSFFPARGRADAAAQSASGADNASCQQPGEYGDDSSDEGRILAVLAIRPASPLTEHDGLYYEKFANRLGFCLQNRLLAQKNQEHIQFVRNLVHDIGHNVVAPNLYFKLLIRQMGGMVTALGKLADDMAQNPAPESVLSLGHLHTRIDEQYREITRHFHQSSFFLETLLRQSHFERGQYVLQRTTLNIVQRVVIPQLERYRVRFQEKDIRVEERYPDGPGPMVETDMGLLSQVMANLFSNAIKYTRETPGKPGRLMRCQVEVLPCYFCPNTDGVRIAVLTSGPPIPEKEAPLLFTESFRASNTDNEYGTGHGLHFIQLITEQHNGDVGYTPTDEGNLFYLTLPRSLEEN